VVKPGRSARPFSWASEVREVAGDYLLRQVVIECPGCESRTETNLVPGGDHEPVVRVACGTCGFSAERAYGQRPWPQPGSDGRITDPWFHATLWLQSRCAGHVLWALNLKHLAYIEEYVISRVRNRNEFSQFGAALGEQLPKWLILAKNREAVLRSVADIRSR
jgi:hypothetical protein